MKAVRIDGANRVVVAEVPSPEPAPGEVLVRVRASSLCATDRRMARLGTHAPRIPGHEIAGVLGDGTPVGVHPNLGCGRCARTRFTSVGYEVVGSTPEQFTERVRRDTEKYRKVIIESKMPRLD